MLNTAMIEVTRDKFSDTFDWWNLVVATDGSNLKEGNWPKTMIALFVELVVVTITMNYPSKRKLTVIWVGGTGQPAYGRPPSRGAGRYWRQTVCQ